MNEEEWRRLFKDTVVFSLVAIVAAAFLGFIVGRWVG